MQRDLHAGVAGPGAEVEPVEVDQLLAGDQPEPEVERHRLGVAGVVGQPPSSLEVCLLQNIIGVDPAGEPAIEPEPDQPTEPLPLGVEERGERGFVPAQGAGRRASGSATPG